MVCRWWCLNMIKRWMISISQCGLCCCARCLDIVFEPFMSCTMCELLVQLGSAHSWCIVSCADEQLGKVWFEEQTGTACVITVL
jgi:hypothetical protein